MDDLALSNPDGFVAINSIHCKADYVPRFRALFQTRAHAIDQMNGFRGMEVLEPLTEGQPYLVVSHWDSEAHFQAWTNSDAFAEGHRRAFADLKEAKARGEALPMHSEFRTYHVVAR